MLTVAAGGLFPAPCQMLLLLLLLLPHLMQPAAVLHYQCFMRRTVQDPNGHVQFSFGQQSAFEFFAGAGC